MTLRINKKIAHFSLVFLGVIIFFLIQAQTGTQLNTRPLPKEKSPDPKMTVTPTPTIWVEGALQKIVEDQLRDAKGKYAVVVKNLKTGESFYQLEHESFETASLYKIWIMAAAFEKIAKGELKEDEVLTDDVAKLNETFHISTESAELTEGTVSFTVEDALNRMITVSHNYAALLLSKKIRLAYVTSYLKSNNLSESFVGEPPKSTANDIAMFFEKLYRGEIGNQETNQEMINLLKQQKLKNKIPKYLPKETVVAHKTGELSFFTHDAGIVFGRKTNYLITILSESNSPIGAEERIAKVSQAVYDYFEN